MNRHHYGQGDLSSSKGIRRGRVFFDTVNGYLDFSIQMVFCKIPHPLSHTLYRSRGGGPYTRYLTRDLLTELHSAVH